MTPLPALPASPETANVPIRTSGAAAFLVLMPLLFVFAPTPTGLVGPLMAIGYLGVNQRALRQRWREAMMGLLVLLVGGWGLLGWFWAIRPGPAATDAALFLLEMLPLCLMAHLLAVAGGQQLHLNRALIAGLALAAVLLAIQVRFNFLLRSLLPGADQPVAGIKLNVPAAAMAIAAFAGLAASARLSWRWQLLSGLTLLLIGWCALAGVGSAPRLAIGCGILTYAVARLAPRLTAWAIAAVCGLVHVAAPFLGGFGWATALLHDYSWRHRMDIWALAGRLIADRPLLGYGFLNSDAAPFAPYLMPLTQRPAAIPSYPHNVLLQVQLEQGLPGVVLFYAALGYLLCRVLQQGSAARAAGLATIAAALSVWMVGYPFSRGHWVGWLAFVGIAYAATSAGATRAAAK